MSRPFRLALAAISLGAAGCLAPGIPPVHPMTALTEPAGSRQVAQTLGYAAAPGAGLGDSVIPGTPYTEAEVRYAPAAGLELSAGLDLSFQRYFLPWPGALSLGTKLTVFQNDDLAVALAPRVVGASAFNLISGKSNTTFGTRELGGELPVLLTHRFENELALTGSVWGRYYGLKQEDSVDRSINGDGSAPIPGTLSTSSGHTWAAGGALLFSFPKIHHSPTRYHLFLGVERLWLTQTGSSTQSPFVQLARTSLTVGVGSTGPW
jgi:hypothetical protein